MIDFDVVPHIEARYPNSVTEDFLVVTRYHSNREVAVYRSGGEDYPAVASYIEKYAKLGLRHAKEEAKRLGLPVRIVK